MTSRYMLDTDICVYFQSGRIESVVSRIARLATGEAVLSLITYGELRAGAERSARRERSLQNLEELIGIFPVMPMSVEVARDYAAIRADLQRQGNLIGANDLWIAAHARAERMTLVTNNEREFRRVPGLAVENWAAE